MRLWHALENIPGWSGVRSVWREQMGEELQFLEPLLRPSEHMPLSVPVDGCVQPYRVVRHADDDIVAVDPETGDVVTLNPDSIVLLKLDGDTLFRGIASALDLVGTPASVGMGNRLWWLGDFIPIEGERFPVYLATSRDAISLVRSAGHVSALSLRPFVFVTPTRAGASEELTRVVEGRASAWITLAESLTWQGEGVFEAKEPVAELFRSFVDRHISIASAKASAPRFPTPMGTRWENISIRFRDGHTVSITAKGHSGVYGYAALGMSSAKNNTPTRQWELLQIFAAEGGVLTWQSRKASPKHRKQKQLLSEGLRQFFGLDDDPFVAEENGWRARFRVVADS